jgi:hypothetical protein
MDNRSAALGLPECRTNRGSPFRFAQVRVLPTCRVTYKALRLLSDDYQFSLFAARSRLYLIRMLQVKLTSRYLVYSTFSRSAQCTRFCTAQNSKSADFLHHIGKYYDCSGFESFQYFVNFNQNVSF